MSHTNVDEIRDRLRPPNVTVEIAGVPHAVQAPGYRDTMRFMTRRAHPSPIVRYFGLRTFLRSAFGWEMRYLWRPSEDPVSQLMARSAETRGRVVAALLKTYEEIPL